MTEYLGYLGDGDGHSRAPMERKAREPSSTQVGEDGEEERKSRQVTSFNEYRLTNFSTAVELALRGDWIERPHRRLVRSALIRRSSFIGKNLENNLPFPAIIQPILAHQQPLFAFPRYSPFTFQR